MRNVDQVALEPVAIERPAADAVRQRARCLARQPLAAPAVSTASGECQVFRLMGLRKRAPGPPPFSLMNSTPAEVSAPKIFAAVSARPPRSSSVASNRLIV